MGILPRASQLDRAIPRAVYKHLPKKFRPTEMRTAFQRKRTQWRIYFKHDCRREVELYSAIVAFFTIAFFIQFGTPIEHYLALPSSDPNRFLKDPYVLKQITAKQQREEELRQRVHIPGDDLANVVGNYTHSMQQ
jgi:hypothetical protein